MRKIAIGDIHGCTGTLIALTEDVLHLQPDDEFYFVGDFVDRGPYSKEVIDYILALRERGHKVVCLRGNHEQLLLDSLNGFEEFKHWMKNGGDATLQSFGVESTNDLDEKYLLFFDTLDYYIEVDNYIMVHAGLNLRLRNPLLDIHSMLWTREFDDIHNWLNGRILVHGHTPQSAEETLEQLANPQSGELNIDCGCVYDHKLGLGQLCAFDMTNKKLFFQKKTD